MAKNERQSSVLALVLLLGRDRLSPAAKQVIVRHAGSPNNAFKALETAFTWRRLVCARQPSAQFRACCAESGASLPTSLARECRTSFTMQAMFKFDRNPL
jgi:hypothetical protein